MTRSNDFAARRILCVFPHYEPSFGTFEHAYALTDGTEAFMPPQGLLTIAAAMPAHWDVRFTDENMGAATAEDFAWADAVFVSGMHIQRRQIDDINRRAHAHGKVTALGGPSVSACPETYPDFDYLHVGEMGDATDALIACLGDSVERPAAQVLLRTKVRRELNQFPMPAYELAKIDRYLLGSIQFSSGCPYKCEFCDIPGLYGRVPRLKTPERICAELDELMKHGVTGSIYFVDDNIIGNRKAIKELLPHLIAWQQRNGFLVSFACEATLNIARSPDVLAMMREAAFDAIFCGIETPEPDALMSIDKGHNMVMPILDAVNIINSHGIQVVSGIILGLDSDTAESGGKVLDFHRGLTHPHADDQPAAGAAADAAVGPPEEGRAHRRAREPRVERPFRDALRRGARHVAPGAWRRPTSPRCCSIATGRSSGRRGPIASSARTRRSASTGG